MCGRGRGVPPAPFLFSRRARRTQATRHVSKPLGKSAILSPPETSLRNADLPPAHLQPRPNVDILHTVSRTFKFCAAHRLLNHPGRCRHLHGHNYLATVIVQGDMVQATGMVLDFAWLKEKIGLWIDDNWDHNILLNRDDPLFKFGLFDSGSSGTLRKEFFRGKEPFATDQDPTAEVLAAILVQKTNTVLPLGCKLRGVTVRETEDCSAGCEVTYEETT